MISMTQKISDILRRRAPEKSTPLQGRRLGVETLEDRCVPAGTATGMVSGVAFADFNGNHVHEAREVVLPGVHATLTGKTTLGSAVSVSATTDANGAYSFLNVQPGTYQLGYSPTTGLLGNQFTLVSQFSVQGGQAVTRDIATPGVSLGAVSLKQYLSDPSFASSVFQPAGSGTTLASPRANSNPTLLPTANLLVSDVKNAPPRVIDLAGTFTDPDYTNSLVSFKTSVGDLNVQLFDTLAPKTVANFFNYVVSNHYDNAIFHRLGALDLTSSPRQVLQGGGFKFTAPNNQGQITPITPVDHPVEDEAITLLPNAAGTLAMATTGAPNSATDQFFFNLTNNTASLTGRFTAFGKVDDPASQSVLDTLAASNIQDKSSFNGNLKNLPLRAGAGTTNFPTSTVASDYALIQNVTVVRRDESLTYSVVSNNNPTLVTATVLDNRLSLNYQTGQTGAASVTIRATDQFGATLDATFSVVVS